MGKIYELDGKVLLIGVGHDRNSSLHMAETRAQHGRQIVRRIPIEHGNQVVWQAYEDVADDEGSLFPEVGRAFESTGEVTLGQIGLATSRLMKQRRLVDFATAWLDQTLARSNGKPQ